MEDKSSWIYNSFSHTLIKENAHCVMHTHTNAGMAMAALKQGLINIDFSGSAFHNKVAYHDFEGLHLRNDECEHC